MLLSALGRPALLLWLLDLALGALLGVHELHRLLVPGDVGSALVALLELVLGLLPGLLVDGDPVDLLVAGCGVWPLVGDVGLALVGLGCLLLLLVALVDGWLFFGCASEIGERIGFLDVDFHVGVPGGVGLCVGHVDAPLERLKLVGEPSMGLLLRLVLEGDVGVRLQLSCELGESGELSWS